MPAGKSLLTTLKSLYVGALRHQDSLAIVTDNADRLKTNLIERLNMDTDPFKVKAEKEKPEPTSHAQEKTIAPPEPTQIENKNDYERGDRSR